MTVLKILGAVAALTVFAQPAFAQDADPMDHSKMETMDHSDMNMMEGQMEGMDHSKMDHSGHDHATKPSDDPNEVISEGTHTVVAKVNGLVCDFCAQALRKVFKKEDAVEIISVDLDAGEVRVFLKDGQNLSDERLAKLIRKSGYSLVDITHENGA